MNQKDKNILPKHSLLYSQKFKCFYIKLENGFFSWWRLEEYNKKEYERLMVRLTDNMVKGYKSLSYILYLPNEQIQNNY